MAERTRFGAAPAFDGTKPNSGSGPSAGRLLTERTQFGGSATSGEACPGTCGWNLERRNEANWTARGVVTGE